MNESELVKGCLKGKRDSQKHLYELFAPGMLGVCYRYASSVQEAEDFLQEAFILVFRKLDQYKAEGPLGAWIRRIVINTSLNCIKAQQRVTDNIVPIDTAPDNTTTQYPGSDRELMQLIQRLPTGYRTVFNLYAIEGYSHEEIGKMLDIQAGTSRSQYIKARKMLMEQLNTGSKSQSSE